MCLSCGCNAPMDSHGNPDHFTIDHLQHAADAANVSLARATRNIVDTLHHHSLVDVRTKMAMEAGPAPISAGGSSTTADRDVTAKRKKSKQVGGPFSPASDSTDPAKSKRHKDTYLPDYEILEDEEQEDDTDTEEEEQKEQRQEGQKSWPPRSPMLKAFRDSFAEYQQRRQA